MNKTAIITGANGGMGSEITKALARAGYTTIMACLPSENAELVCNHIKKETNGDIVLFPIDLAVPETIFSFVEKVKQEYAQIDLLIKRSIFGYFFVIFSTKLMTDSGLAKSIGNITTSPIVSF